MSDRIFHKMHEMIAWNSSNFGLVGFTPDGFKKIFRCCYGGLEHLGYG